MENDLEPLLLLTLDEAAKVLQVSKRTVRRMVDQKEFPAFKVADSGVSVKAKSPNGFKNSLSYRQNVLTTDCS